MPVNGRRMKTLIKTFEGTHRFHNYTKDIAPTAGAAQRYIMSATIDDTLVFAGNVPCARVTFHGASFLLHQIRRMNIHGSFREFLFC